MHATPNMELLKKRRALVWDMHFCLFFEGFGEYLFSSLVYVVFCGNMLSVKYIIVLCSNIEEGNPVQLRVKSVVTKNGGGAAHR